LQKRAPLCTFYKHTYTYLGVKEKSYICLLNRLTFFLY
jgi:hypothetical protein